MYAEADERHLERLVVLAQGVYFAVTGIWPLLHIGSFMKVTGPKTDVWLVKTISALIVAVSVPFLLAGSGDGPSKETRALAAGSAVALGAADLYYVAKGTLRKTYLLDALPEALFLAFWLTRLGRRPSQKTGL